MPTYVMELAMEVLQQMDQPSKSSVFKDHYAIMELFEGLTFLPYPSLVEVACALIQQYFLSPADDRERQI